MSYDLLDAEMEAMEQAESRRSKCQCGGGLPGTCPGPASCPHSDYNVTNDDEDEDQQDE